MKLTVSDAVIAENLDLSVLPRKDDIISITDINNSTLNYQVVDVKFTFKDSGKKIDTINNTGILWDKDILIEATAI